MILYTTMPQEAIFQTATDEYAKQSIVDMDGVSVLVEQTDNHQCRILRILSTDPNHFLNDAYLPGQLVSLKPQL